eukprot:TRINITY_DN67526_c5_g13_i1.p1 TRINITY_DN67526_c5_g13~~TRINITY_DN67526_c5_g13_i1.p1  ORF type:complete len:384 (+),score=43.07 TRINITY_DN67526_c5_g13_i1:46-1197(+)
MDLDSEYAAVEQTILNFEQNLQDILQTVAEKRQEFQEQRNAAKQKVKHYVQQGIGTDKKIQLNIGGQRFTTTEKTLLREKDSFFWTMLRSGEFKPDDDNEYFVDRSPNTFGLILEYLRTGAPVGATHLSDFEQRMLNKDLDFYQIRSFFSATGESTSSNCGGTDHTQAPILPTPTANGRQNSPPTPHKSSGTSRSSGGGTRQGSTGRQTGASRGNKQAILFSDVSSDKSVTLSADRTTLTVKDEGRAEARYYTASFPPGNKLLRWRVSVTGRDIGAEPNTWICSVGVGNSAPVDENVVDLGLGSGEVYTPGDEGNPFVEWKKNSTRRVITFELDKAQGKLTISTQNNTKCFDLTEATLSNPVPLVWCGKEGKNLTFKLDTLPV